MKQYSIHWALPDVPGERFLEHTVRAEELAIDRTTETGATVIRAVSNDTPQFVLQVPEGGSFWIVTED